jgi:hypothetical protein
MAYSMGSSTPLAVGDRLDEREAFGAAAHPTTGDHGEGARRDRRRRGTSAGLNSTAYRWGSDP